MRFFIRFVLIVCFINLHIGLTTATSCGSQGSCAKKSLANDVCCGKMDGINYCDSSTGRLICNNGYTSSCYCTRHAIMDFQLIAGCCLWHGGVLAIQDPGVVVCNDGSASEECTSENTSVPIGIW